MRERFVPVALLLFLLDSTLFCSEKPSICFRCCYILPKGHWREFVLRSGAQIHSQTGPTIRRRREARMGTRPQGRALPFPGVWERKPVRSATLPVVTESVRPNDEELMSRLQSSDPGALQALFDRFSRLVMGVGLRILGDRGEAEEIVQEVFLFMYQRAALFDAAKGTARQWIVQAAYHRALDRREYLDRRGFYLGTDIESLDDALLGETDLDREIGSKLSRAQLEKAFEELPERQRLTLEMFYFEGLELRDISEKLNEPLANIRHHYYRGLEKLRKNAFVRKMREK